MRPSLRGVTVNPAYPAFDGTVYTPAAVEAKSFVRLVREGVHVPAFDILGEGGADRLFELSLGQSATPV